MAYKRRNSAADIDRILAEAIKSAPHKVVADGMTYKQSLTLDNGGYHTYAECCLAANEHTPGEKVQRMFNESKKWKEGETYGFGPSEEPVAGACITVTLNSDRSAVTSAK